MKPDSTIIKTKKVSDSWLFGDLTKTLALLSKILLAWSTESSKAMGIDSSLSEATVQLRARTNGGNQ